MILIKTPEQIKGIRESCRLASAALDYIGQFVVPFVTTNELNKKIADFIYSHNAIPAPLNYKGFPKETCTSVNEVICHGIPSERFLKNGDIIKIDVTTILNGFYGDTCRTFPVGKINKKAEDLIFVTKEALRIGIEQVKPGNHFGNIGWAIEKYVKNFGYSIVEAYAGHGTGCEFHESPPVLHTGRKNTGPIMKPNMVFTCEPMLCVGKSTPVVSEDGWTASTIDGKLSAQFEHTILVTESEREILTF